jgi:ribosomal protein L37AE/L43A
MADVMMTAEIREQLRRERLSEVGAEPECPWCKRPRVARSDYIRCNGCGVNWLNEEMHLTYKGKPYLEVDPRLARSAVARTGTGTQPTAGTSKADV